MKHSTKMILIEIVLIIACLFCLKVLNISHNIYLLLLIALAVPIHFLLKPEKRTGRFDTDVVLIIIISILFYYAITNFIGFFSGFYYSKYSKSLTGMTINVVSALIIILSIENIREALVKNNAYHKLIVILTPIICSLLEIPSLVSLQLYTTNVDLFNVFLSLIIPCISKNFLLSYITYKTNKNNSIIYQSMLIIPRYFLPVFPNFGDFIPIIIDTVFPIIVLILIINITTVKFNKVTNSRKLAKNKIHMYTINIVTVSIILLMIYLTSNMFRFSSLAIGSESMTGTINKGDIIIIDKKYKEIKESEVIAFLEDGKVIVHRVIGTKMKKNRLGYVTKGDANESEDGWLVNTEDIQGKVIIKVKWVGWPTVLLSEMLQGKEKTQEIERSINEKR